MIFKRIRQLSNSVNKSNLTLILKLKSCKDHMHPKNNYYLKLYVYKNYI